MSFYIRLSKQSDYITQADRRAIRSVMENLDLMGQWFSMGGRKMYCLSLSDTPGFYNFETKHLETDFDGKKRYRHFRTMMQVTYQRD